MPDELQLLLISLPLAAHLLCVNLAAGGPIVWIWLELAGGKDRDVANALAKNYGGMTLAALVIGALAGLVVGWALWSEDYRQLIIKTGSRWWFGVAEWGVSVLILTACWIDRRRATGSPRRRCLRAFAVLFAGTNLLYHFPVYFAVFARLKREPNLDDILTSAQFRAFVVSPEVASRAAHVVLACAAVAGLVLAWAACRSSASLQDSDHRDDRRRWCRRGYALAIGSTLIQILIGFWVLVSLPRAAIARISGNELFATAVFLLSLAAATRLVHTLVVGMRETWITHDNGGDPATEQALAKRQVGRAVHWMAITIWCMTYASLLATRS